MAFLTQTLRIYRIEVSRTPVCWEDLIEIEEAGDGYLEEMPVDPWGNDYIYCLDHQRGFFSITSTGADGSVGGKGENADFTRVSQFIEKRIH